MHIISLMLYFQMGQITALLHEKIVHDTNFCFFFVSFWWASITYFLGSFAGLYCQRSWPLVVLMCLFFFRLEIFVYKYRTFFLLVWKSHTLKHTLCDSEIALHLLEPLDSRPLSYDELVVFHSRFLFSSHLYLSSSTRCCFAKKTTNPAKKNFNAHHLPNFVLKKVL